MMMSLDQFAFGLSTLAHQELQRQSTWRHAKTPRVGAREASQFLGPGEDTFTLSGVLMPNLIGSRDSLDQLRAMADKGEAYALVDGNGTVYGAYLIENMTEGHTEFDAYGVAARIEFTLILARTDDENVGPQDQGE